MHTLSAVPLFIVYIGVVSLCLFIIYTGVVSLCLFIIRRHASARETYERLKDFERQAERAKTEAELLVLAKALCAFVKNECRWGDHEMVCAVVAFVLGRLFEARLHRQKSESEPE